MALTQRVTDIEQLQAQRIGYMAVSLTEYDSDLEPEIAEGSVLEIGGAVYEAAADEPIAGWGVIGNDNDVYILIDAGTLGADFTLVAPTWSTTKQGWYDGLDRYVARLHKDGVGGYAEKLLFRVPQRELPVQVGQDLADAIIDTPKIANNAINAAKIDWTLGAGGSVNFTLSGQIWAPAAGAYLVVRSTVNDNIHLEIFQGGAWRRQFHGSQSMWSFITDGASVRLITTSNALGWIYYRKLA